MAIDYYDLLGVERDASAAEIRRAYREAAKRYHPDRNRGNEKTAAELFVIIQRAADTLLDPDRRTDYDSVSATNSPPSPRPEADQPPTKKGADRNLFYGDYNSKSHLA